ncbi:hypothetical protein P152DRAFT_405601 [Eremomyces bilateralis CBS 781.70]|uniref:Integral membrane protein n=1 Tax=Eremomyces bilateralis CBS 781.70 TaxID=1392243 RepID=A0A6G1FRT4_9PEZI|nr:uncharacterized protein P152DRAFT_405601 [Eremomyces bilateralis CBS 781.70]KAF1808382.1 hypothetical protein P152DRAFT_405601 [Eremomyces bilateralis CBS 781.70]
MPTYKPSYFADGGHPSMITAHIILSVIAWVVILPLGVVFSVAGSRYTLPAQFLFLLVNAVAVLFAVIYNASTPDLYEHNVHHPIGWAITWIAVAWAVMAILNVYTSRAKATHRTSYDCEPVSAANIAQYDRLREQSPYDEVRWSGDSGQGTERHSSSLLGAHTRSPSIASETRPFDLGHSNIRLDDAEDDEPDEPEKRSFLRNTYVDKMLSRNVYRIAAFRKTLKVMSFIYTAVERTILILGFLALTSGGVVYGGIFRGKDVFGGLAHFVKGGIFFWYGLVTLGRWMGSFADLGWAWNVKPPATLVGPRKAGFVSAEFMESFLIFLYGASNIFLEHLGGAGGPWRAQDLEHVSITIMFFGGGLLGMLIESHKVRELLNTSILVTKDASLPQRFGPDSTDDQWDAPKQYRFPMNPMPGVIVLLLGIMMSSHHQHSMTSAMVHKQWGMLFVAGAISRAVTYVTLYISPPTSYLPSRPPSEIVTAFCLIGGGLIFMESTHTIIYALDDNKIEAMFVFTVTMGLSCLIMAWETVVIAIKGWAVRRENWSAFSQAHA